MTSSTLSDTTASSVFTHEYLDQLLARGIKVLRVIHSDLFGRQRGKQYPIKALLELKDGLAYSKMANAEDLLGVPVDAQQFPALASHPDQQATLDSTAAFVPPWEPDALWVLCRLHEDDEPSALCPRSQLTRASSLLRRDLGFEAVAAGEPEFYLFSGDPKSRAPHSTNGVSYTMDRITDPTGAVGRMHRQLIGMDIGVTVVNREFSPGQFEINLKHGPIESAADSAFLLKTSVKELAALENLKANFMAKPLNGEEGSSLHVHLSLWNGEENVFATKDGSLSTTALSAIAGLQVHAAAIMAFAAPTVNSYKRLTGDGLSPRSANWGENDRFTYARVPAEREKATRIELRAGDASASPHLLMAAMLHATRDGITRGLTPLADAPALPGNLSDAIDALDGNETMRAGFGEEFVSIYSALKRREVAAYESTVTDWEWDLYGQHC